MSLLLPEGIRILLTSMTSRAPVFLLGAGASAPEMPTMKDLVREVTEKICERACGFILGAQRTPLVERFFPTRADGSPANPNDPDGRFTFATHEESIRLAVHECLDPSKRVKGALPQYEVFRLINPAAVILNYNTDGLAEGLPQKLHWMHGKVIPGYTADLAEWKFDPYYAAQEGVSVAPRTFVAPAPESADYVITKHLDHASGDVAGATALIVVGYSFGMTSDGFDDGASFRMVRDLLRDKQVDVAIADPGGSGERLAEALTEETRSNRVFYVPVYWHLFARALLATARQSGCSELALVSADAVIEEYTRLLGIFERNGGVLSSDGHK